MKIRPKGSGENAEPGSRKRSIDHGRPFFGHRRKSPRSEIFPQFTWGLRSTRRRVHLHCRHSAQDKDIDDQPRRCLPAGSIRPTSGGRTTMCSCSSYRLFRCRGGPFPGMPEVRQRSPARRARPRFSPPRSCVYCGAPWKRHSVSAGMRETSALSCHFHDFGDASLAEKQSTQGYDSPRRHRDHREDFSFSEAGDGAREKNNPS